MAVSVVVWQVGLLGQPGEEAGEGKMSSESFCLAAQARFDSKWLKTDLQVRRQTAASHLSDVDWGCSSAKLLTDICSGVLEPDAYKSV